MAHHDIKFEGLVELQNALASNSTLEKVKACVRVNGSELQDKAKDNAEFKGHYRGKKFIKPTGNLKGEIKLEIKNNGLTAEVKPEAEYSAYVELGTRKMEAQPYLKPAYIEQVRRFKKDLDDIVK